MAIFLSYSHEDADFADRLAMNLVKRKARVWVDRWELSVGDSITARVQDAIQDASALLVLLSKASVASGWCAREINSGLVRELEERRVVVLPLLIQDCEIPLFLRDKLYADFRTSFDDGLRTTLEAISRVTSEGLGRFEDADAHTDWSIDWFVVENRLSMRFTFISHAINMPYSVLTVVQVVANDAATERYVQLEEADLGWFGRQMVVEALALLEDQNPSQLQMVLEDQFEKTHRLAIADRSAGRHYTVTVSCRRLGEDTGKDVFMDYGNLLREIREHERRDARDLTEEEARRLEAAVRGGPGGS
jgi:hypothetical protein